jgi:hypothetical protein
MNLAKLKAIAEKRTSGRWRACGNLLQGCAAVRTNTKDLLNFIDIPPTMESADNARFIAAAANHFDAMLAVCEAAKEMEKVYQKIKDRGLIGQRDLYQWYQDEADLFYPMFQSLKALEEIE